jgi:hypothetical protein
MIMMTATYSPEDNKLRLYSPTRLDPETYARVKGAGFSWAPKQGLFVAPKWTPGREDLLIELAGEIGDEDTSLVERSEERAGRFDEYSDHRRADAESARKSVAAIADNIPLGQPILVGHHSERHARRDAERIENGMRKTVRMWETAEYWRDRAAGAIRHAKYKERADVRARRIKGIEADKRKTEKYTAQALQFLAMWRGLDDPAKFTRKDGQPTTLKDRAMFIANYDHVSRCFPLADYPRQPPASQYEGEMPLWSALDGDVIDAEQARDIAMAAYECGNAQRARWIAHYENRLTYERALIADGGGTIADKTGPEKGGACKCWASPGYGRGWSYIQKVNKVSVTVLDNWGNGGRDFTRTIPFDKLAGVMTAAQVREARDADHLQEIGKQGFILLETPPASPTTPAPETKPEPKPEPAAPSIDAMRQALREGVKVVAVPQLFPTPPDLAARVVELADIKPGHRVLEPSSGTGQLVAAVRSTEPAAELVHVEINRALCISTGAINRDFLACNGDLGKFDRVVMNPPFENGADIRHIEHALGMLKPGGRLVAICGNGPRQRERLQPQAISWEDLPPETFKNQGTGVRAVLLVIEPWAEAQGRLL